MAKKRKKTDFTSNANACAGRELIARELENWQLGAGAAEPKSG